jgi:superfamily II RNA helicase
MPTKTVVFLELTKPDEGKGKRLIYTDEYLQMAGRAGRRGIDDRGVVIYCPMNKPEREGDVRTILTGSKSIFTSKMSFGFDFIFKSMHSKDYHWVDIVKNSYWYLELQKHKQQLFRNCQEIRDKISAIYDAVKEQSITIEELIERHDIETSIRMTPKERQRQIDSWKNRRIGRKWDVAYTQWKSISGLQTQLHDMELEYETCDDLEVFMGGYASYLVAIGFLQNIPEKFQDMNSTNLTQKGVLATEINEGNALLMPELYLYCVENMPEDPLELLCVLSLFMTGDNSSSSTSSDHAANAHTSGLIDFIHRRIEELRNELDPFGICVPESQWTINESWYNIVYDWIEGHSVSEITSKYGIYEGNLTRGMLQLVNLLNEWRNMATYMGNIQMLSYAMNLESSIYRDIISPDSLYIRL